MSDKVYTDYFYNSEDFDKNHAGYKKLHMPEDVKPAPLIVPPVLKPDKQEGNDIWFTIDAQEGEFQFLPGKKTHTWGYNFPVLGKTIVLKTGQHVHVTLKNSLPELTSFHWHGMEVPGPVVDGGCHAPIYPGTEKKIEFTVKQPAALTWLHAHPCPSTAMQVWLGLAMGVVVTDDNEAKLPIPKTYGVDEFPIVLQDRTFHKDNQLDYRADYDPMGVFGDTPVINAVVKPYVDVTTQKVRLLFLGGSNRREWRLHFSDDLVMTQIAGDDSFLEHPIKLTKVLIGPGERQQVVVDFGKYKDGDVVNLYTDDFKLVEFRIHSFKKDDSVIPDTLFTPKDPEVAPDAPVRKVTMDNHDMINGKRFSMQRIDMKQKLMSTEYWDVTNTNDKEHGMLHPFHIHGAHFLVISRNGHDPYPNEKNVYKDTVEIAPQETVRLKVYFQNAGVFMYHCHIIEHEDAGMMAQIQIVDPKEPDKKYKLMDMKTMTEDFAKEKGVPADEVWMPGMDVEGMDVKGADASSSASQHN
ncbi:multicopper oxidase family protein [Lactobacillus acetotolerans]|jgi:FtsP/CotA-like multicopper oxidase with cupredoxin domain|uniref:Multicopper oxidase domain-containing protein n=2 Tax=Lactobacillus acetotolerans TaxID=1600 RepID=A0A5P5ZMC7_9LACO|nr:multicopper oxidase domain-containing protein [Lactobacillus acetotolerans]KRN39393.1 multicopper oxidase [Lactobacillus acetotolerans DSM 20749 = JCM 3825]QFG51791.1 multicopper oxidase domain-containing protein [Lactobacillus acetotolerans]QGV04067.1 multicopper oxidase domain-containing protein [Lactobacillus acetotolerans]GGV17366.1 multicopper oxidase [Lactobacillus acetotolerans DSM 20749 = JCM 3825]HCX40522.1 copper oxidase [Lactobacillus acetotolerans]